MNTVQLTGRLTRDPELIEIEGGASVCRMRLAVEGMGRGETGYVDVAAFGKPAEAAARVLSKGWLVAVDGRLDYRHWTSIGLDSFPMRRCKECLAACMPFASLSTRIAACPGTSICRQSSLKPYVFSRA